MIRRDLGSWIYSQEATDMRVHLFAFRGIIVPVTYDWADEVAAWCEAHFGKDRTRWERTGKWHFRFRDERDAFEFRIRWG